MFSISQKTGSLFFFEISPNHPNFILVFRQKSKVSFVDSVIVSAETFLAFQPPDTDFWMQTNTESTQDSATIDKGRIDKIKKLIKAPIRLWLFIIPAILGFIHLGVFISHLYIILMRRPGG